MSVSSSWLELTSTDSSASASTSLLSSLSISSRSNSSHTISFPLRLTMTLTKSGVLFTSIPPVKLFATGSKIWLTVSDRWSFCPPPEDATGLDGGAPPTARDQPLWSLYSR